MQGYKKRFEVRYNFGSHGYAGVRSRIHFFVAGILSFLGVTDSPYKRATRKIRMLSVEEALRSDVDQLRQDFYRVFERHYDEILPSTQQTIADDCES